MTALRMIGWRSAYQDRYIEYAIGDWLREKRQSLQISQRRIGADIGVSNVTVFGWEAGSAFPATLLGLRKWAEACRNPVSGRRCKLEINLVDTNGERHSF